MTDAEFLADLPGTMRLPTDRWFVPQGPSDCVRVIRHTHDVFEVEAFGMWGQRIRRRMYCYGSHRRAWAMEQARQWEDSLGLWFDGVIYS